jgi:hypothetical protein
MLIMLETSFKPPLSNNGWAAAPNASKNPLPGFAGIPNFSASLLPFN